MDELKERILSEASELFVSIGCKSITMDSIANSLGMSKRTLYETFKDKEELLEQAIIYKWGKNFEKTKAVLDTPNCNMLEAMMNVCFSTSEVVLKMHMNFQNEMKKFYPKVYQNTFLKLKESQAGYFEGLIKKGISEGLLCEDTDPTLTTSIIGFLGELINTDRQHPYELFTKRELFYHSTIKYIRGISTLKGIKIIDGYFDAMNEKNRK